MTNRDAYKKKLVAQLAQWDARIDVLAAKTRYAAVSVRAGYGRELDELRRMQREAAGKMIELERAGAETWLKARDTAGRLWRNLKMSLASALTGLWR